MALTKPTANITQSIDGKSILFTDTSSQTGIVKRTINVTDTTGASYYNIELSAGETGSSIMLLEDKLLNFDMEYEYSDGSISSTIPFLSKKFYIFKALTILRKGDYPGFNIDWQDFLKAEECKDAAIALFKVKRFADAQKAITSGNILLGSFVTQAEIEATISNILSFYLA